MALGELNLSVEQFANATIKEITALSDGYMRRREALEDLFIIYGALPTYQCHLGKRSPTYKKLTAHRVHTKNTAKLSQEEMEEWRKILKKS